MQTPQRGVLVANHTRPWIVLAVVALLATVLWWRFGDQAAAAPAPTERQGLPLATADPAVTPQADLRTAIASADVATIEVREIGTEQLIAGVVFTPATGAAASIGPTVEDRRAEAGTLPLAELQSRVDWLVHAPGYVPISFRRPDGAGVVHLTKGHSLDVVVRHEAGDPAADAQVWLYPAPAARKFQLAANTVLGVGNPSQEPSTWGGLTDAEGRATFRGVPEGTYRLQVEHAAGFPQPGLPRGEVDIALPTAAPVLVGLLDFHVAAFRPPAGRQIVQHSWLRRSIPPHGVLRFQRLAVTDLQRCFPDCLTFLGRMPSDATGLARSTAVRAVLDDRSAGYGETPLVARRELVVPTELDLRQDVQFRAVTCKVVDSTGTPIDLELSWQELRADGAVVFPKQSRSGEAVLLEPGRYGVAPPYLMSKLSKFFEAVEFDIKDTDPEAVEKVVTMDGQLRVVRLHPTVPDDCEAPLHLSVSSEAGSFGIVNWTPQRGPIEILFLAGPVRIKADSPRFKPSTFEFHAEAGVGPQNVTVPVQLVD